MPPARWFSTIVLALLAAFAVSGSAGAQGGNAAYTVEGVDVDVNAADAMQARQQGLSEARRKAAKMRVERVVAREERGRAPALHHARLGAVVHGSEVLRERSATYSY